MAQTPNNGLAPVLYIPHGGGPLPLLGDARHAAMVNFLGEMAQAIARPSAILVISAHWEAHHPTLTAAERPGVIHDYYGFPPEAYEISYPAPGNPELARRIRGRLRDTGLEAELDGSRGFDHGLFVPLKILYPHADIPCLQLSLLESLNPGDHIELGRLLAPLRKENVLILGSGMSFHNLPAFFSERSGEDQAAAAFNEWLVESMSSPELSALERTWRLTQWQAAPNARYCHPREEHLLPLHVCFGAARDDSAKADTVFNQSIMGEPVAGFLWQ